MFQAKHNILIVDANQNYVRALSNKLQNNNFNVHYALDAYTAQAKVKQAPFHVALINVRLNNPHDFNDWSGIELAIRIQPYTRVVMMAEQPNFAMTRLALAPRMDGPAPACDFVAKEEGTMAIISTLRKVLNLTNGAAQAYSETPVPGVQNPRRPNQQFHPRSTERFLLDHQTRTAKVDGETVSLTEREYKLMMFFLDNAESVITREDIVCQVLNEVYDPYADCNRVNNIISRLRRRVEPAPDEPQFIITRWGSGWMFYPDGDAPQIY